MNPMSVLSVVVKATGIAETNAKLVELEAAGGKAAAVMTATEKATRVASGPLGRLGAIARRSAGGFKDLHARASVSVGGLRLFGQAGVLAAGAAGTAILKLGGDFEESMQRIHGLVGVSQKQVDKWKQELLTLGPEVGKSPKELADALYYLTSSGLDGTHAMDALKISAKASSAGLGDMTKIADAISSAMNAYGVKTMSAAKATNILVATAKAGKAEPEELAATMGRVLPIASQMGVTFQDVGGAVASMSLKGLDAAESVTAVRQMLQALIKPTKQGQEVLGKYGLSLDQVQQSLREKGLLGTLVMLRQTFRGNTQDLSKLFNGVEGFNGVLSLTQNGGRQAAGVFQDVAHNTGLTDEAFKSAAQTAKFQFGQALDFAQAQAIKLALVAFPILLGAAHALVGALVALGHWFQNLPGPIQEILKFVAGAGGLAAGFGLLVLAAGALGTALLGLFSLMAANPFVLLAAAVVYAYLRFETFRNIVNAVLGAVGAAMTALWNVARVVFAALAALAGLVIAAWSGMASVAASVFGGIASAVGAAWDAVRTATTVTWHAVAAVTTSVWHGIAAFLTVTWAVIRAPMVVAFTFYRELVTSTWNVIRLATLAVWGALRPYLAAVWAAIRAAATATFGGIRSVIDGAWHAIDSVTRAVWGAVQAFLVGSWGAIRASASVAWSGIKTAIVHPIGEAIDQIKGLIGHGGKDKTGLVGWLSGAWDTIVRGVGDFAGAVRDAATSAFKGVVGVILKFAITILDVLGKIPGVDFGGTIKNLKNVGKGLKIEGFAHGGAYGRTGGLVRSPITLMGEEAPRHPEFVIPTNPAYRGRALGLLGAAAGALGLAKGGLFGVQAFADGGVVSAFKQAVHATMAGPKAALALFEAGVVESGLRNLPYGDRDSRGALQVRDSTASAMGLDNMSPLAVALAFLTRGFYGHGGAIGLAASMPTASAGMIAQLVQGSAFPDRYDLARAQAVQAMAGGGGGGVLDAIGNAVSGVAGKVEGTLGQLLSKGAGFILDQLPGVGSLPDWLKGTGKYVLDHVASWVKSRVGDVLGAIGLGGGDGGGLTKGISGTIRDAIAFAHTLGFGTPAANQLTGGQHAPNSYHYLGRAADFGLAGHTVGQLVALFHAFEHKFGSHIKELFFDPVGYYIKNGAKVPGAIGGHGDHVHLALAQGGMFGGSPFVGAYRNGGRVPEDGFAYVHKGETVTPAGQQGGPLVHVDQMVVQHETDVDKFARSLAWAIR